MDVTLYTNHMELIQRALAWYADSLPNPRHPGEKALALDTLDVVTARIGQGLHHANWHSAQSAIQAERDSRVANRHCQGIRHNKSNNRLILPQ